MLLERYHGAWVCKSVILLTYALIDGEKICFLYINLV